MEFWLFMFVMNLITPVVMIGFGRHFSRNVPKNINSYYGYRTSMSKKNYDTWDFAHRHFGRTWYVAGWILLPLTVGTMLLFIEKSESCIGNASFLVIMAQAVLLVATMIPTEIALRKRFDKDGNKKITPGEQRKPS